MSGHSHYSTIKRTKEAKDAAKGKVFSKMARGIHIAIKAGGGSDPETNYKLRMAIDAAKAVNMPKNNIERAIAQASKSAENIEEITYEGFGPFGIFILVDVATDNKNRSSQEIKNIFERGGGSMAGPGAVSFNFDKIGEIIVKKNSDSQQQILNLIDLGVEDVVEEDSDLEVYVLPSKLSEIGEKIDSLGYQVSSKNIVMKPKTLQVVDDIEKAKKVIGFLDELESHDDVQDIYTNLDIPDEIAENLK